MARSASNSRRGRSSRPSVATVARRRRSASAAPDSAQVPFPSQENSEEDESHSESSDTTPESNGNGEGNHLKTFETHGVSFYRVDDSTKGDGSKEHKAECPFCGKKSMTVNDKEGFYRCWDCGKTGNKYTFLQHYYDFWFKSTQVKQYESLSKLRKLPKDAFSQAELAWDRKLKRWLIPIRNAKGSMVNLRHWNPAHEKPWNMNTAGCKTHLYNLDRFVSDAPTIVLCEGEWDAIALEWLLTKAKVTDVSVLAAPGADIFKEDWASQFNGKNVFICYDNDARGEAGIKKVVNLLHKHAKTKSLHKLVWPESYESGFDLRDFIGKAHDNGAAPKKTWEDLKKMMEDLPLHDPKQEYDLVRTEFKQVVKDFEEHIFLSRELTDGLALSIATVISNHILPDPYCPVWLFLTGPSGSGKTLILQSLSGNDLVICRDKLTANVLVSMYKTPDGSDASLLPHLIGKCFVLKDWTVVMRLPSGDQEIIHSIMRVAFDGKVDSSSGLGVSRSYPEEGSEHETCHFTFLSGVTDAIYLENRTDVGERTLKYRIMEGSGSVWDILSAAADNTLESKIPEDLLRASANAFVNYLMTEKPRVIPKMPQKYVDGIKGLAQIACICSTNVFRKQGDVLMPPSPAVGSRMTKMMIKLAQSLAFVLNKKEVDDEVYRVIKRVALSTCHGWAVKVVTALLSYGEKGALREEIMAKAAMKTSTTHRVLEDLIELEAVTFEVEAKDDNPTRGQGQPPRRWFLAGPMKMYLQYAKLKEEDFVGMPIAMPRRRTGTPRQHLDKKRISSEQSEATPLAHTNGISSPPRKKKPYQPLITNVQSTSSERRKMIQGSQNKPKTKPTTSKKSGRRVATNKKRR